MDAALREKLFNPDTSEEERDVICNVAFGKSFEESLREIRYDDFVEGVGNGFYRILSAMVKSGSMVKSRRGTNESESMVREIEIKFMCQGAFDLTANFVSAINKLIDGDMVIENNFPKITLSDIETGLHSAGGDVTLEYKTTLK